MAHILFILAAISFGLDAVKGILGLNIQINLVSLGFCFLTIAIWLV